MIKEIRPQVVTRIFFEEGIVKISSIDREIQLHEPTDSPLGEEKTKARRVNETCIFYSDNTYEIAGTYDDHFEIAQNFLED